MKEASESTAERPHVFNYQLQRLMIGVAAGLLPLLVWIFGCNDLTSISASYHSGARNIFVACLSAVGALMIPYQGKNAKEKEEFYLAKIVGVAAIVVAFVPTACPTERDPIYGCLVDSACSSANDLVHTTAAVVVFGILMRLCWIFRRRASEKQDRGPNATARAHLYLACMVGNALGFTIIALDRFVVDLGDAAMFRGEAMMLGAFSVAWLTASQTFLVNDGKRPTLMPPRGAK